MFSNNRCDGSIFWRFIKKVFSEIKYIGRGMTIEVALPLTLAVATLFAAIILSLVF